MFQFKIKIDPPSQIILFFKVPNFWVFTQAKSKYPKNIYLPSTCPSHITVQKTKLFLNRNTAKNILEVPTATEWGLASIGRYVLLVFNF